MIPLLVTTYGLLILATALWILFISFTNIIWLFSTGFATPARNGPRVSVLVPARNEEARIGACLDSLLAQNYEDYQILVYDDDSQDGTGAILDDYERRYPERLAILHGKEPEQGWYGKPHAMQKLAERADGAYLLFTDADTVHKPDSIGMAIAYAERYKAELVTGYPLGRIESFGEGSIVPSIYLLTMAFIPLWLVHVTKTPAISHAIGQYMCFKTSAFWSAGGYGAVRNAVSEDVEMARRMKRKGFRVAFCDLKAQVTCRMYGTYSQAMQGISKNVYDYMHKKATLLVAGTALAALLLLAPVLGSIWLPAALKSIQPHMRISLLTLTYAWTLVTMERMLPWYIALIHPLIIVNALSAAWRAFRIFLTGKAIPWKGRMVK